MKKILFIMAIAFVVTFAFASINSTPALAQSTETSSVYEQPTDTCKKATDKKECSKSEKTSCCKEQKSSCSEKK